MRNLPPQISVTPERQSLSECNTTYAVIYIILTMATDSGKNNGTDLPDTDKAAVLGGLDKIIKDRDLYREERDRSLDLNHKFEEIVQRQDQELAGLRGREGQNENEVRRILIKDYKYNPEKLNGKDPVQELYKLQEGAAASYTLTSDLCRRTGKQSIEELREYLVHKVSSAGRKPDRQSSRNWKYVLPSIGLVALAAIGGYSFVKGRQQSSVQPPPTEQKYDQKQKSASGPNVATLVEQPKLVIESFTCNQAQPGDDYAWCGAGLNKRNIGASCDWANTSLNPQKNGRVSMLDLNRFKVLVDPAGGRQRISLTCPDDGYQSATPRSATLEIEVNVLGKPEVTRHKVSTLAAGTSPKKETTPNAPGAEKGNKDKKNEQKTPIEAGAPAPPPDGGPPATPPAAPAPTATVASPLKLFVSLQKRADGKKTYQLGDIVYGNFNASNDTFSTCSYQSPLNGVHLGESARIFTVTIPDGTSSGDYSITISCEGPKGKYKGSATIIVKKEIATFPKWKTKGALSIDGVVTDYVAGTFVNGTFRIKDGETNLSNCKSIGTLKVGINGNTFDAQIPHAYRGKYTVAISCGKGENTLEGSTETNVNPAE